VSDEQSFDVDQHVIVTGSMMLAQISILVHIYLV
jgi:hypothetical protein